MSVPGEITLGEAVRRVDEIGRRLDDVVRRMEEAARAAGEREARFESLFLPRREFELSQQADAVQTRGLEAEVHNLSRRLEQAQQERKDDLKANEDRWKLYEDRRRQDRTLTLSGLVFPVLVALLVAFLLAEGGVPA